MADPQQWNRYAYAKNNPLRFTDPTGLSAECATAHCETVEVSADAPQTYVDTSATHHGNVCGMPLTEDIEFAINPDGTCYTWFYKSGYMFISGSASATVPTSGTPDTTTTTQGPVVHGSDAEVVTDAIDRTQKRITRFGSCGALFDGGAPTAIGIMNGTSYHLLSSGPAGAAPSGTTVLLNRNIFSTSNGGGFDVVSGTKVLGAGLKREFMLVHETLHQASHLNRLAPGVSFPSDGRSADPEYPHNLRMNNSLVLSSCFSGE